MTDPSEPTGLSISEGVSIPFTDIGFTAIRSRGPGGQHVNKTSSAVQLRFDVQASTTLDDSQKKRVLALADRRISSDGIIIIKAQRFRSQEKNRLDALDRLATLVRRGLAEPKPRRKTRPGKAAKRKRLDEKKRRGQVKALRRRLED